MADFPQWLTRSFYPSGLVSADRFKAAYEALISVFAPSGAFGGDNLIAFGRNLSFATDKRFFGAFMAAGPDEREQALAWRCHVLHWAALRGLELEGDFVEAACYRGFSARVIVNATDFGRLPRTYWLYDLFSVEYLPGHHQGLHEQVCARFADTPNVKIVKGSVPAVLAEQSPQQISFLHLDMNNAAAEIGALDALYDRVAPGAFIVLDDYGWAPYAAQKAAHDAWFSARGKMVVELPTGQGLVIK